MYAQLVQVFRVLSISPQSLVRVVKTSSGCYVSLEEPVRLLPRPLRATEGGLLSWARFPWIGPGGSGRSWADDGRADGQGWLSEGYVRGRVGWWGLGCIWDRWWGWGGRDGLWW